MAAQRVNQKTVKRATLKKMAKRRRIGTGDGGLMTQRMLDRNKTIINR